MTDAIIIGAGMSGLSAALELKKRGRSFVVLEAEDEAGGRARTRHLASGLDADLGAHWVHGKDNPLSDLVRQYGIPHHRDDAANMYVCQEGRREKVDDNWLEAAIDPDLANRIKGGQAPDVPMAQLGKDEAGKKLLFNFGRLWDCIDPPAQPSAREFLTDENTPGGLQLDGGMKSIISRMTADIGAENIHLNTPVTALSSGVGGAKAEVRGGEEWEAEKIFFTGSLGVLNSGMMTFDPPFSDKFRAHLSGLSMGAMDKIILEFDAAYFEGRGIASDTGFELLDGPRPHFCHLRSAGAPLITLFITGKGAAAVEDMDPETALAYAERVLAPIEDIRGWQNCLASPPLVTHWLMNPYARGAYSCCLPGARRSGPRMEGNICFCGDTFDDRFPASLAGAFLSGQKAAETLFH